MPAGRIDIRHSGLAALFLGVGTLVLSAQTPPAAASPNDAPYTASRLTRQQVLDQLTSTAQRPAPSVDKGKATFEKLCAGCHFFKDLGRSVGPDLSAVGSRFKKRDILDSILWPSKAISDQYIVTTLELNDGSSESGLVFREDEQFLYLRNADHLERPLPIPLSNIKERTTSPVSLMPERLMDGSTLDDIDNLVAFLLTGKD